MEIDRASQAAVRAAQAFVEKETCVVIVIGFAELAARQCSRASRKQRTVLLVPVSRQPSRCNGRRAWRGVHSFAHVDLPSGEALARCEKRKRSLKAFAAQLVEWT